MTGLNFWFKTALTCGIVYALMLILFKSAEAVNLTRYRRILIPIAVILITDVIVFFISAFIIVWSL